jgi:ABC-type transport system substrate-binding protein
MASATSTASSTITLATLNSEELLKVSQNIKEQLANSGINVEIKSYDKDELVGKVIASRDFEMLLFGAEISDTSMLYPLWHSSFRKPPGSNISGYLSTTLDKNLEAIIATTSPSEIDRLYSEIKNEINSEYAWIPLYTTTITGFTPKQLIITNNHAFMQGLEGRLQYISKEYIKTEPLWRRLNTANSNKRSNIAEIIYNFIH